MKSYNYKGYKIYYQTTINPFWCGWKILGIRMFPVKTLTQAKARVEIVRDKNG
jgi:hypothetical protein